MTTQEKRTPPGRGPRWRWARRAVAGVAVAALVVGATGASAVPVQAATSGRGTPEVTRFALSDTTVDVRERSRTLTVEMDLQETVEPVREITRAQVTLASPRHGVDTYRYLYMSLELTSGTTTAGTWTGQALVRRWTVPGEWTLSSLRVRDAGGGYSTYSPLWGGRNTSGTWTWDEAWPVAFTVLSVPDTTDPVLTSLTFSPRNVDTRAKIRPVRITARAKDSQSGVGDVYVVFTRTVKHSSTSWTTYEYGTHLVKRGSVWKGTFRVPMWVGEGTHTWRARVRVLDKVENSRGFAQVALRKLGAPRTLKVRSATDRDRPWVTALALAPDPVDVTDAVGLVEVTARARDASSGAQAMRIAVTSPSGTVVTKKLVRDAGPRKNTGFTGALRMPRGSAAGVWRVSLTVTDLAGVSREYTSAQLAAAGVASTLTVTSS